VAQKFLFAILRIEVTRASRGFSAINSWATCPLCILPYTHAQLHICILPIARVFLRLTVATLLSESLCCCNVYHTLPYRQQTNLINVRGRYRYSVKCSLIHRNCIIQPSVFAV